MYLRLKDQVWRRKYDEQKIDFFLSEYLNLHLRKKFSSHEILSKCFTISTRRGYSQSSELEPSWNQLDYTQHQPGQQKYITSTAVGWGCAARGTKRMIHEDKLFIKETKERGRPMHLKTGGVLNLSWIVNSNCSLLKLKIELT